MAIFPFTTWQIECRGQNLACKIVTQHEKSRIGSSSSFALFLPCIPQHTLTEYFLHAGCGVPEVNRQPLPALRPDSLSEKQTRRTLTNSHSSQHRRVCIRANTEQQPASCSGSGQRIRKTSPRGSPLPEHSRMKTSRESHFL